MKRISSFFCIPLFSLCLSLTSFAASGEKLTLTESSSQRLSGSVTLESPDRSFRHIGDSMSIERVFTLPFIIPPGGEAQLEYASVSAELSQPIEYRTRKVAQLVVRASEGNLPALLPPVSSPDFDPVFNPIPVLSEQTDMILGELGYDSDQIATLRSEDVI